ANSPPAVRAVQAADRTIPIVFVSVSEPLGPRPVSRLAPPGGYNTRVKKFGWSPGGKKLKIVNGIGAAPQGAGIHVQSERRDRPAVRRLGAGSCAKSRGGSCGRSCPYAGGDRSGDGELRASAEQRFDRSPGYPHGAT